MITTGLGGRKRMKALRLPNLALPAFSMLSGIRQCGATPPANAPGHRATQTPGAAAQHLCLWTCPRQGPWGSRDHDIMSSRRLCSRQILHSLEQVLGHGAGWSWVLGGKTQAFFPLFLRQPCSRDNSFLRRQRVRQILYVEERKQTPRSKTIRG